MFTIKVPQVSLLSVNQAKSKTNVYSWTDIWSRINYIGHEPERQLLCIFILSRSNFNKFKSRSGISSGFPIYHLSPGITSANSIKFIYTNNDNGIIPCGNWSSSKSLLPLFWSLQLLLSNGHSLVLALLLQTLLMITHLQMWFSKV